MQKSQKKIIIFIVILLVIISIIAVFLSLNNNSNNAIDPNNTGNNVTDNETDNNIQIQKEIGLLTDEETFFGLQDIINNYYINLESKNKAIYNTLDTDYITENNITENNVFDKINFEYETVTYITKEIYYNPGSDIEYYFINGYLFIQSILEEDFDYKSNVNFLVIVNRKNNNYVIRPLNDDLNIESFAKTYNIKEVEINNNVYFKKSNISLENKLSIYIDEFMDLMFLDTERSYNMLDSDTKLKYPSLEIFTNEIENIYESLTAKIFSYNESVKENEKIYLIKDQYQKDIKIIEYNVMNFQIGF